jgi:uncharacterized protein
MQPFADADVQARVERDNPWWNDPAAVPPEAKYPRRVYFEPFKSLALNFGIRRATVLLGPRRVGKTVMIKQAIADALESGINRRCILYVSVDTPIYSGFPLEKFLQFLPAERDCSNAIVLFDEIQYLKDWEIHLKDLVDNYPDIKFIATGSAAAALRLKSKESGAGRFSDFMLPPLTFYEYLLFSGEDEELISVTEISKPFKRKLYKTTNVAKLNDRFVEYLNYGGYPEVVLNAEIRNNPEQFIKNDIIDKVLLKDLPSLYGITEIQELNRLFAVLAYNAGNEASIGNISQESGLAKPTIKRYIEYLESAFLLIKLPTVDDNCRTMQRERNFKIYLNNPSMRAALFAPVKPDDHEQIGHLAESAIFSQWQHSPNFRQLRYARWKNEGEVDIVYLNSANEKPAWIGEIKWSDRVETNFHREAKGLQTLLQNHKGIQSVFFTSRTWQGERTLLNRTVTVTPSALYCYIVGRNITSRLDNLQVEQAVEVPKELVN